MKNSSAVDFNKKRFLRYNPWVVDYHRSPLEDSDYDSMGESSAADLVRASSLLFKAFNQPEDVPTWERLGRKKRRHPDCAEPVTLHNKKKIRILLPETRIVTTSQILRNKSIVDELKYLYGYKCQVCGKGVATPNHKVPYFCEAHHIQPLGRPHNGPDVRENLLIVCPNHHKQLDYGGLILGKDKLKMLNHSIEQEFIDYSNREIACI